MIKIKIGSINAYKNIKGFTSAVQRKILGIDLSHLSIYIGINELGRMEESEANLEVGQTTLVLNPDKIDVYKIAWATDEQIKIALNDLIDRNEERIYDFFSWLAIFIRVVLEWIIGKFSADLASKVKGWNLLFGFGIQCSSYVWELLNSLIYAISDDSDRWNVYQFLHAYNKRLFNPKDFLIMHKKFKHLLPKINYR